MSSKAQALLIACVACASITSFATADTVATAGGGNGDAQHAFLRAVDVNTSGTKNPEGNCPKLTTDALEDCAERIPKGWPGAGTCIKGTGLKPGYYCSIGASILGVSHDSGALCDCPALWHCKADKASVKVDLLLADATINMGMCVIPWYTFVVGILICLVIIGLAVAILRCLFCPRRDAPYQGF